MDNNYEIYMQIDYFRGFVMETCLKTFLYFPEMFRVSEMYTCATRNIVCLVMLIFCLAMIITWEYRNINDYKFNNDYKFGNDYNFSNPLQTFHYKNVLQKLRLVSGPRTGWKTILYWNDWFGSPWSDL